jgi:NitT/TauT family transport system permease protein
MTDSSIKEPSSSKLSNKTKSLLWKLSGVFLILVIWEILAQYVLYDYDVILDPFATILRISELAREIQFWQAIGNTLLTCLISFVVAFILSFLLALISHFAHNSRYLFSPLVHIFRAAPVVAVILFLFLTLPWVLIPFAVAFLVTFPLLYTNILASLDVTSKNELDGAKSIGLNRFGLIKNIYLPNMFVVLLANLRSAVGLNLKVVIAAEVMGIPTLSLGSMMLLSKQTFAYQDTFCLLVVTIVLAMFIDWLMKICYTKSNND